MGDPGTLASHPRNLRFRHTDSEHSYAVRMAVRNLGLTFNLEGGLVQIPCTRPNANSSMSVAAC